METPTRLRKNPTPRRRRKKKYRVRLFLFNFFLFSIILGLSAVGYASWKLDQAMDNVTVEASPFSKDEAEESMEETDTVVANEVENEDTMSVLILGRDYRPETGTNLTDVMIVAAINKKDGQVSMVSIPRDTKVDLPRMNDRVKANEAFNYGEKIRMRAENNGEKPEVDGGTLAKEMAGNVFGIDVDHYVVVDFQAFMAIVDEVGGITVNVERDLIYNDPTDGTHINLKAGNQRLNGKKALDWVRHRHDDRGTNFYSSDFDRNRRQKEAIKAILSEMTTWNGFSNVFNVLEVMSKHIKTDLTKDQLKDLTVSLKNFNSASIQALETPNVYWDSVKLQTVIPEEDLSHVHQQLEQVLNKGKME